MQLDRRVRQGCSAKDIEPGEDPDRHHPIEAKGIPMKQNNRTPRGGQVKPASHKNHCCSVPPADGCPAMVLPMATKDNLVQIGRQAAERYLAEGQHNLPGFLVGIRQNTPPRYWDDVEAGFMARLQQRLDSDQLADNEMQQALAVGSSVTKDLHESATRLIELAIDGGLVPTTEASADHLARLAELIGRITCVGLAGSGSREAWL